MVQLKKTEEGVHPSETPLCGQHDNQTEAQSPEKQQIPESQVLSKPMVRIQALSTSASLSPLVSGESSSSDLKKDVATDDDDSVHSSHSGISLERKVSSGSIDMSRKRRKTESESCAYSITFKKKCTYAMGQCEETEEGVHPSETPLCGQHDNQTKAQSTPPLLVPTPSTSASLSAIPMMCTGGPFRAAASLPTLVSGESSSSDSEKDVATNDDDSDQSSHSRISLESQASSGSSCVSNQSKKSKEYDINFKKKENEKTSPPTTQELVVGSSAGIETKSTNPPVAAD